MKSKIKRTALKEKFRLKKRPLKNYNRLRLLLRSRSSCWGLSFKRRNRNHGTYKEKRRNMRLEKLSTGKISKGKFQATKSKF